MNIINTFLKIDLFLLFMLQLLKFTFLDCIDNIIDLGGRNFRYNHFSYNSEGDMIIDTHSFPKNDERLFFGLKNNGQFYFTDSNNEATPYYSLSINHANHVTGRLEGESIFIKSDNEKEYLCGISKLEDNKETGYYVELYNLQEKNNKYYYFSTIDILGYPLSDVFSVIKHPDQTSNKYIFTYIVQNSTDYYLVYKISHFRLINRDQKFITDKDISLKVSNRRSVTCFLTENLNHVCFFQSESKDLKAMVYDMNFNDGIQTTIYTPKNASNVGAKNFIKAIHLKKEIGFFIYYKEGATSPTISLYLCKSDRSMVPYSNFADVTYEKGTYKKVNIINDVVKLNDNQVCFVSTDSSKNFFNIIVFSLYKNDELMNIRHYLLSMWNDYRHHKIFLDIKINLYKSFLCIAYSHCPSYQNCSSASQEHYTSLIIFGYPNSTESSLDVIP